MTPSFEFWCTTHQRHLTLVAVHIGDLGPKRRSDVPLATAYAELPLSATAMSDRQLGPFLEVIRGRGGSWRSRDLGELDQEPLNL